MNYTKLINKDVFDTKKQLLHLKDALETYHDYYQNKKFYIELSNGKTICVDIPTNALPHVLGFKKDYVFYKTILKACGIENPVIDLYEFINYLADNAEEVAIAIKNNDIDRTFTRKIGARSFSFHEYENLEHANYVVCKKEKNRAINDRGHLRSDYFIIQDKLNEEYDYNSMGINTKEEKTYVEALFYFRDANYNFQNQIMTIPKRIITETPSRTTEKIVSIQNQINLLKNYSSVIRINDMVLDLTKSAELKEAANKMKLKVQ